MGYGLNSPITFDEEGFQTPNNRAQVRALTSTPRKMGKQSGSQADQLDPPMNKTRPQREAAKQDDQLRSLEFSFLKVEKTLKRIKNLFLLILLVCFVSVVLFY